MGELTAQDALSESVRCVAATDRPAQLGLLSGDDELYAVFLTLPASGSQAEAFLGFVPGMQAIQEPERRLGELLGNSPPLKISPETPADEVVEKLRREAAGAAAVFDARGRFIGAVTVASVLDAQTQYAADLQERLRQYRKSVQKDKRKRQEWSERLEKINKSFKKLIALLARPAGPDHFQRGIETLTMLLDASYGAVVLTDSQGQFKESILAGTTPGNDLRAFLRHRKPLVENVLSAGTSLLLEDVPDYLDRLGEDVGRHSLKTFLGVPIRREDQCFGCVYFCNRSEEEIFSPDDETLAYSFANSLALILAQAQDRAGRKRAEQERELLAQLSLRLSGAAKFDRIGQVVAEAAGALCPWEAMFLAIRHSGITRFRYVTRISNMPHCSNGMRDGDFDLGTSPEYLPLLEQHEIMFPQQRELFPGFILIPVQVENELAAILGLQRHGDIDVNDADSSYLTRLANTIGPAVARCQAEARNAAFLSLAYQLPLARTPTEAARVIVTTAEELFGWDSCSVSLYYPDQDLGTSVLHMDLIDGRKVEFLGPYNLLPPGEVSRRTMTQGPQLILRDSAGSETKGLDTFGDTSRRSLSLMFVPLRLGPATVGVFSIQSYARNAYTSRDLEFLQALADLCAGTLERIRPDPQSVTGKGRRGPRSAPSERGRLRVIQKRGHQP